MSEQHYAIGFTEYSVLNYRCSFKYFQLNIVVKQKTNLHHCAGIGDSFDFISISHAFCSTMVHVSNHRSNRDHCISMNWCGYFDNNDCNLRFVFDVRCSKQIIEKVEPPQKHGAAVPHGYERNEHSVLREKCDRARTFGTYDVNYITVRAKPYTQTDVWHSMLVNIPTTFIVLLSRLTSTPHTNTRKHNCVMAISSCSCLSRKRRHRSEPPVKGTYCGRWHKLIIMDYIIPFALSLNVHHL